MELLVPRIERTEPERRFLRATRTHLRRVALRWGMVAAALITVAYLGYRANGERHRSAETQGLVERLTDCTGRGCFDDLRGVGP